MFVPLDSRIKAKQMTSIMDLSPDAPYSRKKKSVPDFNHVAVDLQHVCLDARYVVIFFL